MDNYLFELKTKELDALGANYQLLNDILVVFDKYPVVLGCRSCYMVVPTPTQSGYKIPAGDLINYNEKYKDEQCSLPSEVSRNCWLCPKCNRVFKELLPNFDFVDVKNVSL